MSLALLSIGAWAFVVLASEVAEGDTHAFDRALLLALRDPNNLGDPIGPGWLEEAARDITGLGGYAVLTIVTLATVAYLLMVGKRGAALLVVCAVGGGMLLSTGLKLGFERPRPDLVPHGARVYTASFPSGHAMLSADHLPDPRRAPVPRAGAAARQGLPRRPRASRSRSSSARAASISACTGRATSWPAGAGGAAWAALCWFAALQLQRRGRVEGEGEVASASDEPRTGLPRH